MIYDIFGPEDEDIKIPIMHLGKTKHVSIGSNMSMWIEKQVCVLIMVVSQ